eukprot:TRINITY_DN22400_c0_g1_i3.p1 TRINITY_DN22400_c0_g1~~TRINITY_DN22400_c0_g1_i3.p1  ORF type:complete len:633 (+),score=110.65 TRINITY_DN22400_c0_g1_i3:75-1973(+)
MQFFRVAIPILLRSVAALHSPTVQVDLNDGHVAGEQVPFPDEVPQQGNNSALVANGQAEPKGFHGKIDLPKMIAAVGVGTGLASGATGHELGDAPAGLASHTPALCDASIVTPVCAELNGLGSFFGTAMDKRKDVIHAAELAKRFMVARKSIQAYFKSINLTNKETSLVALQKEAYAVTCMDLCKATIASIPENVRPPSSDIGCRMDIVNKTTTEYACDVDLQPETIKKVKFSKSKGGKPPATGVGQHPIDSTKVVTKKLSVEQQLAMNYPEVSLDDVRLSVAELFRVYPGTRTATKFTPSPGQNESTLQAWEKGTVKTSKLAAAMVNRALMKMSITSIPAIVVRFFGDNSEATRREVRRILRGVKYVLSNAEFQLPGSACDNSTAAYVTSQPPKYAKTSSGAYIVSLCPLFFEISTNEQIRTIVHEGTHHLPMDTRDVIYGYDNSTNLAKSAKNDAIANAENYCYFVSDANHLAGGAANMTGQATLPVLPAASSAAPGATQGAVPPSQPPVAQAPVAAATAGAAAALQSPTATAPTAATTAAERAAGHAAGKKTRKAAGEAAWEATGATGTAAAARPAEAAKTATAEATARARTAGMPGRAARAARAPSEAGGKSAAKSTRGAKAAKPGTR